MSIFWIQPLITWIRMWHKKTANDDQWQATFDQQWSRERDESVPDESQEAKNERIVAQEQSKKENKKITVDW